MSFSVNFTWTMNEYDINDYLPSILNPRRVRKQHGDLTLTQNSIVSRCSLSLKKRKNEVKSPPKELTKPKIANVLNNNSIEVDIQTNNDNVDKENSVKFRQLTTTASEDTHPVFIQNSRRTNKENSQNSNNVHQSLLKKAKKQKTVEECSIGFSAVEDLNTIKDYSESSPFSFGYLEQPSKQDKVTCDNSEKNKLVDPTNCNKSLITLSSATELDQNLVDNSQCTVEYEETKLPVISVSFGVKNCDTVNVSTKYSSIKNIVVSHKDHYTLVDCEMTENYPISIESDEVNESPNSPKKLAVTVNLEIKKQKSEENSILILNTDAIERLSHVIVQPPNYKLVKRQITDSSKFKKSFAKTRGVKNVKLAHCGLKQRTIDSYFIRDTVSAVVVDETLVTQSGTCGDVCDDMSRKLGVADTVKGERHSSRSPYRLRKEDESPKPKAIKKREESPRIQNSRSQTSEVQRFRSKNKDSATSQTQSARKNVDSIQFSLSAKSRSNRSATSPRTVPYYKIVAGTHFAVDAFSYGEIPQVKHYFLTHFHSDHYAGLKKGFNKALYCSKITADLCESRLGVSGRHLHVLNPDESITIDDIDVTAVDANHCPGAIMLLFTLNSGKTMLHTGDFRASPAMESYPVFWNRDIHTVYLDTTYCNPRYDFPTQDQSLEMALYYLRQKKLALEKVGKKFSSVLIVCGTYTIGKEKFFLGMARRVGCSVWACPEKDKVLQIVEGRSFSHAPPQACQLHVVPMRDLTHEKLRSYLETLQGAFTEVVAFKPSGWENGKNSTVEKEPVTIHGIPYSEHSSFSEMIRFVKFLKPQLIVPTVDISGGSKSVQRYFPCPLVVKEEAQQSRVTDYFSIQNRQQSSAVT